MSAKQVFSALFLSLFAVCGFAQQPAATEAVPSTAGTVKGVQIGMHFEGNSRVPLWAVMVGDTTRAESVARFYASTLGPYALDATLWVRDTPAQWSKVTYRRPQNIDELLDFHDDAATFTSRETCTASLLPLRIGDLRPDLLRQIDFIIRYDDGSAKAYLLAGTSRAQLDEIVLAISASASDEKFPGTLKPAIGRLSD